MMSPLLAYKAMTTAQNAQQMQGFILNEVALLMSLVSSFGSMLAAWAAVDSVAGEMRSGTILVVMARSLRRWEFLAGKYLGVLMLMGVYVLVMLGVTFLLAWLGGQRFHTALWTLLVYPMVRYAIWAAISMFLVTLVHPILAMGLVVVLATLVEVFGAKSGMPAWFRLPVHLVLPLTGVLSELRFLAITRASLKAVSLDQPRGRVGIRTELCPGVFSLGGAGVPISQSRTGLTDRAESVSMSRKSHGTRPCLVPRLSRMLVRC